jgi:hypothetical protein
MQYALIFYDLQLILAQMSERGAGLGVLIPRHAVFNIKHVSGEGI